MTSKKDSKYTGRALKCESCGEVSQHVGLSTRYNKKLCFECLRDVIIADIQSKPY